MIKKKKPSVFKQELPLDAIFASLNKESLKVYVVLKLQFRKW